MAADLTTIGFDADDTLWQNETFFRLTQERFSALLCDYAERSHLEERLLAAERRNLGHYGFGIKGFVLSMIETAIEVTQGRVSARVIAEIMAAGRDRGVAAIAAQCPMLDGRASARLALQRGSLRGLLRGVAAGLTDVVRSAIGKSPHYVPRSSRARCFC